MGPASPVTLSSADVYGLKCRAMREPARGWSKVIQTIYMDLLGFGFRIGGHVQTYVMGHYSIYYCILWYIRLRPFKGLGPVVGLLSGLQL